MNNAEIESILSEWLVEVVTLTDSGEHEAALSLLDFLYRHYAARDADGMFQRAILRWKGLVFENQGNFRLALRCFRRAQDGSTSASAYLMNQRAIARILEELGRPSKALDELERGLDCAIEDAAPAAVGLLDDYLRIGAEIGRELPARYHALVRRLADVGR